MDMDKELNCSEGARMLIERMQTHPDDFKPGGRFYRIAEQVMGLAPRGYGELSDRDDTALSEAYGKYILEPQLTEFVVDEIFNGDKRRAEAMQQDIQSMYSKSLAASMMNTKNQLAANVLQGGVYNPAQGQAMWNGSVPDPTQGQIVYLDNNGKELTLWQRLNQQLKQLKKSATA